jgi:hypothetical protein
MESQISFAALSKTFQDAVTVAHMLSVQDLWIDSFCIVQDCAAHWDRESAQMASVYENAFLVISASHASDSFRGCFSERLSSMITSTPCYQILAPENIPVPIYLRTINRLNNNYDPNNAFDAQPNYDLPLLNRSWAFQERLLGTHTVHFTGSELVCECREKTFCECTGLDHSSNRDDNMSI